MICINCGSSSVVRDGDDFTCDACHYQWDVAHEQANAAYLASQGRKPAEPMPKTWILGGEVELGNTTTLTTQKSEVLWADGGLVDNKQPYLVGETGTETLIPSDKPEMVFTGVMDFVTFEAMKVEDLKALAAMQGIDLKGAVKKTDIIQRFLDVESTSETSEV